MLWVSLGLLGLQRSSVALAVEQASALLRCCCSSTGLLWVLAGFSAAGMVAQGPGAADGDGVQGVHV